MNTFEIKLIEKIKRSTNKSSYISAAKFLLVYQYVLKKVLKPGTILIQRYNSFYLIYIL